MDWKKFKIESNRTWNRQNPHRDIKHIQLLLVDEAGELAGAIKKKTGYDSDIDSVNVKEECGDLLYALARVCDYLGLGVDPLKYSDRFSPLEFNRQPVIQVSDLVLTLSMRIGMLNHLLNGYCLNEFDNIDVKFSENNVSTAIKSISDSLGDFASVFGFSLEDCMIANIAKLQKRFPNNYNQIDAVHRDKENEREALEAVY